MVSTLSVQDAQRTAEENNFTLNIRAGSQAESSFGAIKESSLFFLKTLERLPELRDDAEMKNFFFTHNQNIAALSSVGSVQSLFIWNQQFLDAHGIEEEHAQAYLLAEHSAGFANIRFLNATQEFGETLLTAIFGREGVFGTETVKVLFHPYDLFESFSTGTNTSFLIDRSGKLLLHPDVFLLRQGADYSALPIMAVMQEEGDINRQISFEYEGRHYFGAYFRLGNADATVITIIPHDIVFEAVHGITRQNIYLAAAVLFIGISFIWFFSKTISKPARILAAAALKIEEGDFSLDIKTKTRDELGLLATSFDRMSHALNIFGHFTNKSIALRAMRGEIKPGGLPKHATILFSDIRNFTEISEGFTKAYGEDAPNRTVLWLNEYFSRMISCVEDSGGTVDKFIGDAVMAHWGTTSVEENRQHDAYNCVKAALMMRQTLVSMNAERMNNESENPAIKIRCGINSGDVIAGQIGSLERMNYTVIGDPVNLTSRVEELNKTFGTDILITESTQKLISDQFITEEMPAVTVKGKEKPVRVFAVINFKNSECGPYNLAEVRDLLDIKAPKNIPDEALVNFKNSTQTLTTFNTQTVNSEIKMTSFGSSACVQGPAGKQVPVFFSWNVSNLNPRTHIIVEVSGDKDFNFIIEKREVIGTLSTTIALSCGTYWWRVYPAHYSSNLHTTNQTYPCGILVVKSNEKERLKIHSH